MHGFIISMFQLTPDKTPVDVHASTEEGFSELSVKEDGEGGEVQEQALVMREQTTPLPENGMLYLCWWAECH